MNLKNSNYKVSIIILAILFSSILGAFENKQSVGEYEMRKAIENYFEGRRAANIEQLQLAFSEDARLMTTDKHNKLIIINLKDYFSVVKNQGEISVITTIKEYRVDGQLGYAEVLFDYGDKSYTDFLLLVKSDVGWRIVSKSFKLNQ